MQERRRLCALDIPITRIVRRGDRHAVHDLLVDVRITLADDVSPDAGDEQISRAVHALAVEHAAREPEVFAGVIAGHCATRVAGARRTQVDVRRIGWDRMSIGGRALDRELIGPTGDVRIGRAIVDESGVHHAAGFTDMVLLTSAEPTDARLAVIRLAAVWYYGWSEVPWDTQWQQVRRAITEAWAERARPADGELASGLARAVLDESPVVREIEVRIEIMRRPAVDVTAYGMEPAGEVFGGAVSGRGVHAIVLRRDDAGVAQDAVS